MFAVASILAEVILGARCGLHSATLAGRVTLFAEEGNTWVGEGEESTEMTLTSGEASLRVSP